MCASVWFGGVVSTSQYCDYECGVWLCSFVDDNLSEAGPRSTIVFGFDRDECD